MNKLAKLAKIIKSCVTYEQAQVCLNFAKDAFPLDEHTKFEVVRLVQEKIYELRSNDISEHHDFLRSIS